MAAVSPSCVTDAPAVVAEAADASGVSGYRRVRVRKHAASLSLTFAGLLFFFPSEVVLSGPLNSNSAPVRIIGMLAVFLLLADLLRLRQGRSAAVTMPVALLVVYIAYALFAYGWSAMRGDGDPAGALRILLFTISACGIGCYTAVRVRTTETAQQVVGLLVAGCSVSAAVGIIQAMGIKLIWVDVVKLPGMTTAGGTQGLGTRDGMVRVFGSAGHPIEFAVILGCCLPLAMHLALHGTTVRSRRASTTAALLMSLALPFALSRGGLICIALSMLTFLTMQSWRLRITTAAGAAFAVVLAYVAVPATYQAVEGLFSNAAEDPSVTGRLDDYPIVDAAFNAAPWLGGAPMPSIFLDNQWLVTLTHDGLVGVGFLASLFLLPALALTKVVRLHRRTDPRRASLAAAMAGGVVAIAFSGTVFDLLYFGQVSMLLFLLIGLTAALIRAPTPPLQQQYAVKTAND